MVEPPERRIPEGHLLLSTRRGKQFNSMVFRDHDPLTGTHRDALFISAEDAGGSGWGRATRCSCARRPARCAPAPTSPRIRPGNVQMFFPECNPLIRAGERDASGVPDYNAVVEVVPAP